jgi:hypothetical protein
MDRYGAITQMTFGSLSIGLPLSVRFSRRAEPLPEANEAEAFATSVQLGQPLITVEVRTRDTAVAEALYLGQAEVLEIQAAPTRAGQSDRTISVDRAVVTGLEVEYEQTAPATARICFLAEATDGQTDPFQSRESSP